MDAGTDDRCSPNHVGQAGRGEDEAPAAETKRDGARPTGQAGTGQSAGPEDYDSDPQAGGGKVQQRHDRDTPATGGDAPSHGSR